MLQIKKLNLTHKKDLRIILNDFNLVLNDGDKAVIIGEEGNGKSTLMKWIYNPSLVENYIEADGERIMGHERLGYLPQEMLDEDKEKTIYEYFSEEEIFWEKTPKELSVIAGKFGMKNDFFYSNQTMGSLSGGEKVKTQLMRLFIRDVSVLLLDEPSNDIDIATKLPYRRYVEERLHKFEIQKQRALSDRREKKIRDEKYQRVMQSVQGALRSCTRQAPSVAKNLKDKMHTVKAMERRFEKEDENMTQMPEQEEAIFVKLGDENSHIPAGKTVIEYELSKLVTPDGKRILAEGIHLKIKGSEKICMIGANGAGKTTLLKKIAEELLNRNDIKAEYMPQTYEDLLDLDVTPVDYLDKTGDKEERTRIRTYLGSLKYTPDEMEHPIRELSGGQKAKVLLLRMSLSGANVLILDEPTRNFSPLSGPVIRKMLREFPGAVISISHDRKYIEEVCDKIYQLNPNGLQLIGD